MVLSIHLADVGWRAAPGILRRRPAPTKVPGLRYAETTLTAPLGGDLLPGPTLNRVGLIAAWDDDGALDEFLGAHPLAGRFAGGWHVRLRPLRVSGAWAGLPDLPAEEHPVDDDEPVAVLTLGRLRLLRARPFLRSGAPAESEVVDEPDLLATIGLARPPHLVSTFSLWRRAAGMRDYAYRQGGAHRAAVAADRAKAFHHESAFVRFRPYASSGNWDGRDPLAGLIKVTDKRDSEVARQGRRAPE